MAKKVEVEDDFLQYKTETNAHMVKNAVRVKVDSSHDEEQVLELNRVGAELDFVSTEESFFEFADPEDVKKLSRDNMARYILASQHHKDFLKTMSNPTLGRLEGMGIRNKSIFRKRLKDDEAREAEKRGVHYYWGLAEDHDENLGYGYVQTKNEKGETDKIMKGDKPGDAELIRYQIPLEKWKEEVEKNALLSVMRTEPEALAEAVSEDVRTGVALERGRVFRKTEPGPRTPRIRSGENLGGKSFEPKDKDE